MKNNQDKTKKNECFLTEDKFYITVGFLATKDEIEKLATKEEIKKLATKKELRQAVSQLATKAELRQLEARLRTEIRITANELEERLDEKSRLYRDQILTVMNDFLEEIKASREERTVIGEQVSRNTRKLGRHEKRISALEKQVVGAV